jgi:hypothetical protein
VVFVSIQPEIALAIEDDVVVDDDLGFGPHRRQTAAVKHVPVIATCGNGVANALLGAWENRAAQRTRASLTRTPGAFCSVGNGCGVVAHAVFGIAGVTRAIVEVIALFVVVAFYARSSTVADAVSITGRRLRLIAISTHPVREVAQLFGAFILIVAIGVVLAQDGARRFTAPNHRHHAQRANAQKSE